MSLDAIVLARHRVRSRRQTFARRRARRALRAERGVVRLAATVVLVGGLLPVAGGAPASAAEPEDASRFATWTGYAIGGLLIDTEVADFNGDGALDVVWARQASDSNSMAISLNLGDGTLLPAVMYPAGPETQDIANADLDGDGTFGSPTARQPLTCSRQLTLADVDADGDLDEVVGNDRACWQTAAGSDVSVSRNDGTGQFGTPQLITMAWATGAVVVADVDRDGHADIVGAASGGAQEGFGDLAVSFGDGSGVFGDALQLFTGHSYQDLVPADLDGDSDIDLVGNSGYDGSTVLLNDGTGIFTASSVPGDFVRTYPESVAIALGDVTGDQLADIAVAHATGSDVGVHAGFGDGTFAKHQVRYGLQARVTDLELADMNGDGALDLVSSASTGGAERLVDGGPDTTGRWEHRRPHQPRASLHDHGNTWARRPRRHRRKCCHLRARR